ncbi:hypothetical protein, partial [Escherichia coli]|uniref:hypothetical protein n=1 Tax=Escherichia coli TaxID=562 RepID=UPI0039C8BAE1
ILGRWWRYKWITFHPSLTLTAESIGGLIDRSSYAVRAKAQELGINRMLRGGVITNQKNIRKAILS